MLILLAPLLLAPGAQAARLDLPKAAPQSGDTAGCPAPETLALRFSHQSDANGGGFGFYAAKYDDNRRPSIVPPSEKWVTDYVAGEAAGSKPSPEDQLRTLWGTRCAYPDLDYVKTGLELVRTRYHEATGVSPETERQHSLARVNLNAWADGRNALCDGKPFPEADPVRGLLQKATCTGFNDGWLAAFVFTQMDTAPAAESDDAFWPAAFVGLCGTLLKGDGMGDPATSEYVKFRQCKTELDKVTPEALDAAIEQHAPNQAAALSFRMFYEKGVGRMARYDAKITSIEKGYPATKRMYDDAVVQVEETYAPILVQWQPTLTGIDDWMKTLSGGPGYAEGCAPTYTQMLQDYVDVAVPEAKGDALLRALRDPVGYRLTEALAMCHYMLDMTDVSRSRAMRDVLLAGGDRISGRHQAVELLVKRSLEGPLNYRGQRVIDGIAPIETLAKWPSNAVDQTLGAPPKPPADPRYGRPWAEDVVVSVKPQGDTAVITFQKRTGTATITDSCTYDYSHIAGIDMWGNFLYDVVSCKTHDIKVDTTQTAAVVPIDQVAKVTPGVKVTLVYRQGGSEEPKPANVVFVTKGNDVIWAGGVSR
ncbi:MAG: hypothetical protein Q8P18_02130 [Pseudomonadota bacterium]|nr:hypothetical protein [Pseudomonadota bacterium]